MNKEIVLALLTRQQPFGDSRLFGYKYITNPYNISGVAKTCHLKQTSRYKIHPPLFPYIYIPIFPFSNKNTLVQPSFSQNHPQNHSPPSNFFTPTPPFLSPFFSLKPPNPHSFFSKTIPLNPYSALQNPLFPIYLHRSHSPFRARLPPSPHIPLKKV